jgi:hypothetical protein
MPHAEKDTTPLTNGDMSNSTPITNGDGPHSKVLSHLHSYPVVHDSFEAYKSHPYGARSLSFLNESYQRFVAPLHPYLKTPYSYLSPYLSKADELGDNGLSQVDTRFPIVKEDTSKLKQTVFDYASVPLGFAGWGKEYVVGTWQDEYSKTSGQGAVKVVKGLISTELRMGLDAFDVVKGYLSKGKKEANKKVQ